MLFSYTKKNPTKQFEAEIWLAMTTFYPIKYYLLGDFRRDGRLNGGIIRH